MALDPLGILGPFSGIVGPVVGCICKTRSNYVRTRPLSYHDAKTRAQLRNRATMREVMAFMSKAKVFAKCTFGPVATTMTTANVATKLNYHKVVVEGDDDVRLEYDKLRLSFGKMMPLDGLVMLREEGDLKLRWKSLIDTEYSRSTDWVHVFVYNETRHGEVTELKAARRGEGEFVLGLPERWEEERLHVYVSVSDSGREHFGNSQYVGYEGGDRRGSWEAEESGGEECVKLEKKNRLEGRRVGDSRRNSLEFASGQSANRVLLGVGRRGVKAGVEMWPEDEDLGLEGGKMELKGEDLGLRELKSGPPEAD